MRSIVIVPRPIAGEGNEESFAGVTYHISGELVPQLNIDLGDSKVYFEHHTMLWKQPDVKIEIRKLSGALKRKFAGGEFFVTQAVGPGRLAFSRDSPGQVFALHVAEGDGIDVREHQFIAATNNVEYSFERIKGVRNALFGGAGFFMDKFRAKHADGIVWVHGHGNVFTIDLEHGEKVDVEPGGWLFKDLHVKMEAHTIGLKTGLFSGGEKFTWNRFTGPGRVGIQTMYISPVDGDTSED
jgi:uncharacterized protein (AIM24 family)